MLIHYLFYILIFTFTLGQLDRIDLGNSVALHVSDGILLLTIAVWIIQLYRSGKIKKYFNNSLVKPVLLFIGVCIISLLVNSYKYTIQEIGVSFLYTIRWALYAAIFFLVQTFPGSVKKRIVNLLIFSQLLLVTMGFIQYFFYPNLRNLFYLGWDDHLYRLFSTFLDPNFAAAQFNLFFFLLLSLFLSMKSISKRKKIFFITSLIITFLAILLTYSRSGFLMFAAGCTTALWLLHKKRLIIVLYFLLVIGIIALPKNLRSAGVELWRTASITARSESAKQAIVIIRDNPILGVGFNAYRYTQKRYQFIDERTWKGNHAGAGTDNSLLFVLATTGIVGFFVYLLVWKKLFQFVSTEKSKKKNYYGISIALFASFAGLVVNSFFINSLFYPTVMFWIWTLMGLIDSPIDNS